VNGTEKGLDRYLADTYLADMNSEKTTTVEALLGVLSLQPMSGYEMRQFMERSTANFWSESFGQIYPALKSMLAEGLVELTANAEDAKERKVYRITEAGQRRLREWLGVPARSQVRRYELLLKVFFGDRAEPGVIAEQVRAWRRRFKSDLARYAGMQQHLETAYAGNPAMPFWRMTLRYGLAEARMIVEWCDETLAELEQLGNRE
jgi:DNA-binding PadR family transcriptional regulator